MIKSLKMSVALFGAVLLLAGPVFAQSSSTAPADQAKKPAAASPQAPAAGAPSDQGSTITSGCKSGTVVEPTKGHVICKDNESGGQHKMVTPQGKHEKM